MSQYQLAKETPPGSGIFAPQGAPIPANDVTSDPVLDAQPESICAIVGSNQITLGGCWSAYKVGA